MHFVTPSGSNSANQPYAECYKNEFKPSGSLVTDLSTDNPTEYAKIQSGEVIEKKILVEFSAGLSNAQKKVIIEERWTEENTALQTSIPIWFQWTGTTGDVIIE